MKRISYLLSAALLLLAGAVSCEEDEKVLAYVNVTPSELTLTEGESAQLVAEIVNPGAAKGTLLWHTPVDTVVTVSKDGTITALKATEEPVRVIASIGNRAGYCLLTVVAPIVDVTGISFERESSDLLIGETLQLSPVILPENASNKEVTYTSSDPAVATVVKTSGLVTAVSLGTAVITVKTSDGGFSATYTINVVKGATGLSSSGTANCYITPEEGEYFFLPVKGNSETSVGDIASLDVLWETVNTTEAPEIGTIISGLRLEDGKVFFTVGSVAGNALIAAKDAAGDVLWSWHIWNTLEAVGTVSQTNNTVILDRNVGALAVSGDLSAGLMFQWGRKDPFLGASKPAAGGNVFIKATAPVNTGGPVVTSEEVGTVEWAVAHPDKFIQSAGVSAWDWYYKKLNDTLWDTEKTIYDPCPPGYRVPGRDTWSGIASVDFPISGRLNAAGTGWNQGPGGGTNYWTCDTPGEGSTLANSLAVTPAGAASIATGTRALGCPIRCVKQ